MRRILGQLCFFFILFGAGCQQSAHAAVSLPGDITCSMGEDCQTALVFKAAGRAVNLTGSQFKAQLRAHYPDQVPMAEFLVDSSQIAKGRITLTLPSAVTAALAGRVAVWDLRLTDPSGAVTYPVRGNFKCLWSATR